MLKLKIKKLASRCKSLKEIVNAQKQLIESLNERIREKDKLIEVMNNLDLEHNLLNYDSN